jgi:alpha-mannosidase
VEIRDIHSTDLFTGAAQRPYQLLRVTLVNRGEWLADDSEAVTVRADAPGVATPEPAAVTGLGPGAERTVDVPLAVDAAYPEGTARQVTVVAEGAGGSARAHGEITVAAPGWTMFMVPHFHYDPVWWNSQAGYLAIWDDLPGVAQEHRSPPQRAVVELVRAHMDAARLDQDYKFVLAELDYLKPYWDAFPWDRAELRRLITEGRVELVGGMYNEPNTNLTSLESTIRNTVYGVGYQREVIGGDPRTGWMLDVFGHDPSYPAVMADAGLTSSSWARGPFHQWGPWRDAGTNAGMQFASEFEWVAPDGSGLLTSYMPNHYSAGWGMANLPTLAEAEAEAYVQFQALKPVAATRNVLLPVGADHVIPCRWATEIQRDWNKQYAWPRFVVGLPEEFFAAVREDASRRNIALRPQSRDMNPIYTGKDVSYIDTKQAQRAAEVALADAEKLATLMTILGAGYPAEAIDKAWRQLCFGAHHDAITGTESDQVYLDLLGGWREAYELGARVRKEAIGYLADHVDTSGEGRPLLVVNTQSWPRSDVAAFTARFPAPGPAGVEVRDGSGTVVPAVAQAVARHGDGTLAEVRLSFVAADVPATGYRSYRLAATAQPLACGWQQAQGSRAESDLFAIEADPGRGGALSRIRDKRVGKELLRPGEVGGELVCHEEYPVHPKFREGPWHLVPNGKRQGTSSVPGQVRAEISPAGQRLVSVCRLGDLEITQEVTAWNGLDRLEFRTHVDGSIGHDRLLRVRFPLAAAGARPVYETAGAAIGRTFGFPDVDAAEHPWTQDNPAYTWAGLSSAVRVALRSGPGIRLKHAIGVAEIIADDGTAGLRDLVAALAGQGVTATVSRPRGPRYGDLRLDSNLPDARISIGGPGQNAFTDRVLQAAGLEYASQLTGQLADAGRARLWVPAARARTATWVPSADLRGTEDLPVLIVAGNDQAATAAAVADLAADLAGATIEVSQPASLDGTSEPLEDYSAALLNRGTPGTAIEPDGTLHLSLMRSCSGWPSGIWTEPPRRTAPDGSSFAWQHWSHAFEYALASGTGDWRDAGFTRAGHAYNHQFQTQLTGSHGGELPASASLLAADPADVMLTALKPHGNPFAAGRATRGGNITLRCQETRGRATQARIRCFVPLREGRTANVLEETRGNLDTPGGTLLMDLGPAQTVTATVTPDSSPRTGGPVLGPRREAAQPVYTRYWLHNKGPAPMGNQLVSVHTEPRAIDLTGDLTGDLTSDLTGPVPVRVTVSATRAAAGTVELIIPCCAQREDPGDLRYDLAAGDYERFDVLLRPRDGAAPGIYHLRARITDTSGQTLEDVVTVRAQDAGKAPDELDIRLDAPTLAVTPGRSAALRVHLASHSRDEIHGEAQLISPYGTWDLIGPWTQGFTVPPGGQATLGYDVRIPAHVRRMDAWALIKVMASGRAYYTESIPLAVGTA